MVGDPISKRKEGRLPSPLYFSTPLLVLGYGDRFACELLIQLNALKPNVNTDLLP